ncbi:snRNA-activating protein complex subunit [Anaeramoeba flamelloides]|uniref:snRNA-activating protein complex subunit n=1 Tax=Anaeramoeba flamelloides TaxID=1746091 RepID=A0AAV7Z2Q3_9EUKA|nr:snRNA-activating protein complex subunit [Anaeramoeba flamelloides]
MDNSIRLYKELKKSYDELLDKWTKEEDQELINSVQRSKNIKWEQISNNFESKTPKACLYRYRYIQKIIKTKGAWDKIEDEFLLSALNNLGLNSWGYVSSLVPGRSSKQCRERWRNQLNPKITQKKFTQEERELLIEKQSEYGNKWTFLGQFFEGRTGNQLKNYWHSKIKKGKQQKKTLSPKKKQNKRIKERKKIIMGNCSSQSNKNNQGKKSGINHNLLLSLPKENNVQLLDNTRKRNYGKTSNLINASNDLNSLPQKDVQNPKIRKTNTRPTKPEEPKTKNFNNLTNEEKENSISDKQIQIKDSFSSIIESNFLYDQFQDQFSGLPLPMDNGLFDNSIYQEYEDYTSYFDKTDFFGFFPINNEFNP